MSAIDWIDHDERVVGRNHPTLTDVANRPTQQLVTKSGLTVDDDFPGFLVRYTGGGSPEGVTTAVASTSYIDTTTGTLYIKQINGGNTGWIRHAASAPNTKNTLGLTISQAGADDECFSLKNSDVAHAMTTLAETDTFAVLQKISAADGGLAVFGYTETKRALNLLGYYTTSETTKSGAGLGAIVFDGAKKSAATVGAMAADDNIIVIRNNGTSLFIADADGDLHVARHVAIGALGITHAADAGITIAHTTDVQAISVKRTGLVHGITNLTATDTYLFVRQLQDGSGGVWFGAFSTSNFGFYISGYVTSGDTGKASNAVGPIQLTGDKKSGTGVADVGANENLVTIGSSASGAKFIFDVDGDFHVNRSVVIGPLGTAPSNPTTVTLYINQGAEDSSIIVLQSTDVAHGMTNIVDTSTFCSMQKSGANDGGLYIIALTEVGTGAFIVDALVAVAGDTTKSTAGKGAIRFRADLKSGTGVAGAFTANGNMMSVESGNTTRFILDADGDSHQDVGTAWTNFDTHDDVALLNLLSAHVTRRDDPLRESFGGWLKQNRDELERIKLVAFDEDGHHFVNMSRLAMLHTGAIRQIGMRLEEMEAKMQKLLPTEVN